MSSLNTVFRGPDKTGIGGLQLENYEIFLSDLVPVPVLLRTVSVRAMSECHSRA